MTEDADLLKQSLDRIRTDRLQRLLDGDLDAMVDAFYAPDARLMPPDQPTLEGREAVREFWKAAPRQGLICLELDPRDVVGSGELAYERGEFTRTLRPKHGHPFKDVGKYLVVYRRAPEGTFRAVAEIFNSPRGR